MERGAVQSLLLSSQKMKKIVLVFLFVPLLIQAQQTDEWLTPFADVRFENDKIIYSFCKSEHLMITGIVPQYYSESLMKLKTDFRKPAPSPSEVAKQQEKIREYLVEEQLSALTLKEQEEYLRLAAMVLIWDLELDRRVISELETIERPENKELKEQAVLILQLEKVYKELR